MGWLASIASIAGIAERIIGKFIGGDKAQADPPIVGPVVWGLDAKGRKVIAKNASKDEVGMLFSKPEAGGENVSLYQPLAAGKGYDATADFADFSDGSLSVAPVVESSADNFFGRAITGTFRLVAVGVVVNMIKGVTFRYNKTGTGYDVTLETTGPQIKKVDIRAVDLQKNSTQTSVEFKDTAAGDSVKVPLPAGVDLEPVAEEITLTVEVDAESYEEAVADRRQLELDAV